MIAWQTQFNGNQIQKVVSYVISLQGSTPPNSKAPQGEKYVEVKEEETPSVETDSTKIADL